MSISLVQHVRKFQTLTASSFNATISATGVGNLIVVSVASEAGLTSPALTSITDNAGNTYSFIVASIILSSSTHAVELWYAWNVNAGATTLTITPAANGVYGLEIYEFSGVKNTSDPLDSSNSLYVANSPPVSPTLTPATTGELLVSACQLGNFFLTGVQSPWTGFAFTDFNGECHAYDVSALFGAQHATFTPASNGDFASVGAVFAPVAGSSLILNLSESMSEGDSRVLDPNKELSESLSETDSRLMNLNKALSETITDSDSLARQFQASRSFLDFVFLFDQRGFKFPNKGFFELVRLDTWTSIILNPSTTWTNSDNNNQFPPEP